MASPSVPPSESIAAFVPELEGLIAEVIDEWKVPGLAIAVVQDGEVALAKAYGLRDVEAGLPVTTNTQFQIASLSKSFTATGVALLVDEGRLDWERPVREYLPEFQLQDAVATDRVTVWDLLCHHSGLPRHDWTWLPGDRSPAEMLAALPHVELSDDIRSSFQYCNLGYVVASLVTERVNGQSWSEFIRTRLVDKLRMALTFSMEELAAAPDAAAAYEQEGDTWRRLKPWPMRATAAGGLSTSIAGLANWLRFHLGKG
jgi:CubicO group peptidase (beta-lactamase class C family)